MWQEMGFGLLEARCVLCPTSSHVIESWGTWLVTLAHDSNPSYLGGKDWRIEAWANLGKKLERPPIMYLRSQLFRKNR
jgi:hypothetical protein